MNIQEKIDQIVNKVLNEELENKISVARERLVEKKNKDEKWIQDVDMDKGDFTEYCGGKVTCKCVEKALSTKGKRKKQAQLYLNMNDDKCKSLQESVEEIDEMEEFYEIAKQRKMERMANRKDKDDLIGVYSNIKKQRMEEEDLSEDSFNYVAALAKVDGKKEFDFGGETHPVTMSLEKAKTIVGDVKKDSVEDDEEQEKDLEKDIKADKKKEKEVKKESKKTSLQLTEDEMIELIERIVIQEKSAIESLEKKNSNTTKKTNDDYVKSVTKKMKEYMKDMGIQYDTEKNEYPRGNTKMDIENFGKSENTDKKKMYHASDAVEEYVDQIARSGGMENLDYDQIKPDDEWLEMNIKGSDLTGNSPEYANSIPTDVNDKVNDRREKNILAKLKKQSYQKAPQPVYDYSGNKTHGDAMKSLDLASIEEKKKAKINEEMDKMKNLISYNGKTQ